MDVHNWLAKFDVCLHDAEVHRLTTDYIQRTLTFDLEIWDPGDDLNESTKELYRPAKLIFAGLEYCVIEAPNTRYPFDEGRPLCIDVEKVKEDDITCPQARSDHAFRCRIFVNEWNAFISICASSLEVVWLGEAYDRQGRLDEVPK